MAATTQASAPASSSQARAALLTGAELERRRRDAHSLSAPFASEYPFEANFVRLESGHVMHYLDEGPRTAPVLLCLHGNPTWSFAFRALVREYSATHRVVVPDHIGCGYSDKPSSYPYRLENHIDNLSQLTRALGLRDVTLVLHDWGGAIGMGWASREAHNVSALVITNTAAFRSRRMPLRIAACRTPLLGRLAVQGLNAFARGATHMALEQTDKMRGAVRAGYLAPYNNFANRIATWAFVRDIPLTADHPSYALLEQIESSLQQFQRLPACILWGEKDWCFTPEFRREWQAFLPQAEVHALPQAGHLVIEDGGREFIEHLTNFLRRSREG